MTAPALCIAFDLDDTLYKERAFVVSGRRTVAREASVRSGVDADELFSLMERSVNAFSSLLERLSSTPASDMTIDRVLEIYRYHKPQLTLPAESVMLLDTLRDKGIATAIITDGRSETQWNKIHALGLDTYVSDDRIIVSEDIGADKHTPVPFELLTARVGAARYMYVGDNPVKDFHYPNLMGWQTVMLRDTDGVNIHNQDLEAVGPDFRPKIEINNLKDIVCLLH